MLIPAPKIDLEWMRKHHPIFAKMEQETQQRLRSEAEYRKILERKAT